MLSQSSHMLMTAGKGAKIPPRLHGKCAIGLYRKIPLIAQNDKYLANKWRLKLCLITTKRLKEVSI
jgi:hypothetical protein